jgi:GNAT superfamily N-acetyltransferase
MGDRPPPGVREVLEVRCASAGEFELAVEILEEAAAWVAARGQEGWKPGSFRDEAGSGRRVLRDTLDAGELFLAWTAGQAVGTVTLQSADAVYWPDAVDLADARYIHRLAVRGDAAGLGIGMALVRWSEGETAASGRPFVRLDCPARNPVLRDYYRGAGYQHRGDVTVADFRASLFEKAL